MFDVGSPNSETPAMRGPHLAAPVGRPQASTRSSGGGFRQDCQTLTRALDLVFTVAERGPMTLAALQQRHGLTKSTAYRLASALMKRGMFVRADQLYSLGPKWLELAALAPDRAGKRV